MRVPSAVLAIVAFMLMTASGWAQGLKYPLPPTTNRITSGSAHTLVTLSTGITTDYWQSAVASAKTETIPKCNPSIDRFLLIVADAQGTAGTLPIAVTPAAGTIGPTSASSYSIASNYATAMFQCVAVDATWRLASSSSAALPTPVNNDIVYATGGVFANLPAVANGVLSYNGSSVPSASTTLPSGLAATNLSLTTPTIVGGALSGTLSGNFTLSGVPIYSGLSSGACTLSAWLDSGNHLVTGACPNGSPITLSPGLASTPTTYNTGTQTVTGGGTLSNQLFYEAHATSYTVLATDGGKLLTATAGSVTLTAPNPGSVGTTGYTFGYDGSHSYTLTTVGGTASIYGCGSASTSITISSAAAITPDASGNYQCTPFGAGAVASVTGTAGQISCSPTTGAVVCSEVTPDTLARTYSAVQTFGAQVVATPVALSGTTVAVNAALGNVFTLVLSGTTTISNPTNLAAGQTVTFILTQASGGGDTVTWSSDYKWPGGTAPTMTTTANAVDMQTCIATSSSVCLFGYAQQNIH